MVNSMQSLSCTILLWFIATPVLALDTSQPVLCATTQAFQCVDGGGCSSVLPEAVNAPTFMQVDVKKKQLRVFQKGPSTKIFSVTNIENRIVLQGAEDGSSERSDGNGWTLSIESQTGRFVGSIAAYQASITLFGACTEPFDD